MKQTCEGCPAMESYGCALGYETERQYMTEPWVGIQKAHKPLEQCPKPKTIKKYVAMSLGQIPGKIGTMNFITF